MNHSDGCMQIGQCIKGIDSCIFGMILCDMSEEIYSFHNQFICQIFCLLFMVVIKMNDL